MVSMIDRDPSASQETIRHLFERASRDFADRNLILSGIDGSIFTFADAARVVGRVVSRLNAEGVRKGDRVCMYASTHVEPFFLFWAAASAGAVFVPLDYRWPEKKLRHVLGQIKPKIMFCEQRSYRNLSVIQEQARVVFFDEPGEHEHLPAGPPFSRWLEGDSGEVFAPEIGPDDAAVILFTSGSTGEPKGVVLSHGALHRSCALVTALFHWTADDIVLSLSVLHAFSGIRTAVAALHAGYSFLVTSSAQRSSALSLAECIRHYRCTQLTTTPTVLRLFVQFSDRIPASDLGSLRTILSAGSILSQQLFDSFYGHFRTSVLNCYAMTETTGLCIGHSLDTFKQAQGSIGLPVGCTAEIVDEGGKVLAAGYAGELRIRSRNLMLGYYNDHARTDKRIRDGWLYTGDLAMKRPDGHFVLMGRIRNIIKNAHAELISLEEVELVLENNAQVREAAVCGFTSSRGDERMAAFIVPAVEPASVPVLTKDLRNYLRQELGAHKVPALFYLKDHLPRNSMGKLLREQLKQEIVER